MRITTYEALILLALDNTCRESGKCRPDLAEELNTPRTTLYDHLKVLEEKGLVGHVSVPNNKATGRRKVAWYATPLGQVAIEKIKRGLLK